MTIISFEHRFIFIKTRKVGGTSVEASLRTITSNDDIVPALGPRDEYFCAVAGHFSRNYAHSPADEESYTELVLAKRFDEAIQFSRNMKKEYDTHMTARQVRRKLGKRAFSDFYSFSIERDPYSWLVSLVAYDNKAYNEGVRSSIEIDELRERIRERLSRRNFLAGTNYPYYTISNRLAVDRVIRYEHLEAEFGEVMREIGVEPTLAIPRLKENPQNAGLDEIITPELDEMIRDRFRKVFELLDYPRLG